MALKLNERYPGRFNSPSTQYPQGSFKNRTAPGAKDGSYLEQDWANDKLAFFSSLLSGANITANGNVDVVGASQHYDALLLNTQRGVVGTSCNAKMSVTTPSSTATFTADELIVQTALGGRQYKLSNFSKTVNLATTGAGGMDTGTVPVSGFVALYAIYNPTTQVAGLLAVDTTLALAPEICAGVMPSGYTSSALVSVWPITASKFDSGILFGRSISITGTNVLTTSTPVGTYTSLSISAAVPMNARSVIGRFGISSTASGNRSFSVSPTATGIGEHRAQSSPTDVLVSPFPNVKILTSQRIFWSASSTTAPVAAGVNIVITGYEF